MSFAHIRKFTKAILIIGIIFVIYGYSCREFNLYFFWESKSIGWVILIIGAILFLVDRIKIKRAENGKTLIEKIAIGLLTFFLIVQIILISVIPFTDAYVAAKNYIYQSEELKKNWVQSMG